MLQYLKNIAGIGEKSKKEINQVVIMPKQSIDKQLASVKSDDNYLVVRQLNEERRIEQDRINQMNIKIDDFERQARIQPRLSKEARKVALYDLRNPMGR